MSKQSKRWLFYPLLLLLAVVLLTGCSSGERQSAGSDLNSVADTTATQSSAPDNAASPQTGDAANTAPPSEPAGAAASPSAEASAALEGAAAPAPPDTASGTVTSPVPAGTKAPATHSKAAGSAGAATAKASAAPGAAGGASAGPAESSAKPAATARPSAGTNKPAATARPAAAVTQPPSETAAPAKPAAAESTATVSITGDEEYGVILAPAAFEIEKGESALELLKRITRKNKIQMEYQGSKGFAYVEGIDNLYEFDHGAESGWMYKVNGEFPGKGAGSYTVQPGDVIEWLYTLDLGKDLGAKAP
ncbi:DUF4430 domain-containing protein [Paenibacillus sp. FSL L8-0463]|uniref:DUF4430 domain-containing protein n=1 Tax=Paenibacillus sp. FSL L8-0463 TaxID=2954687 RepID=UPI003119117B